MTKRCLIYAHWDRDGVVDPYVIHSLRQYRSAVDRIVFVSTNYQIRSREIEGVADDVIVRENKGYDFQSWREGLDSLGSTTFDEVVFTNSSVYGPVWQMERVFASPITRRGGLWGMSISCQHTVHLQSYFMAMSRPFLGSEAARQLWQNVHPLDNKTCVIKEYELTWMSRCLAAGVPVNAFFDARQLHGVTLGEQLANIVRWPPTPRHSRCYRRAVRSAPCNPTHMQWKQMLECGAPFVKIDLFARNPYGMRLSRVFNWLEKNTEYPTDLIRRHRVRVQRDLIAA